MKRSHPVFSILLFVALFVGRPLLAATPYLELAPLLGHVSSTTARVWIKASEPAQVSVRFGTQVDLAAARTAHRADKLDNSNACMGEIVLTNLQPATRYSYCVQLNNRDALLPPYPSFTTPVREGQTGHVRFAFASCVGFHGYDATAGYADMARTNIDLLLMLGDNVYSNTNEPSIIRRFHFDQRNTAGWRGLSPHVPIYAIWDDHDYGPDNSDRTMPGKEDSLRAFQELWGNPAYGEPDNPGVYFKFSRGDVDFFMLDGRYYRDPNKAPNDERKTMLGTKQLAWFKRELLASRATIKVLASGGEWQAHGTDDSWRSFKSERRDILNFIETNSIQGVLLISGDRHYTGAYHVEGKWIEVTTGPIGSASIVAKNAPESFLNFSATKGHFYCVYDLDSAITPPRVTLEVYRVGDGLVERRPFSWDEVRGVKPIKLLPPPPQTPPPSQPQPSPAKDENK